MDAASAAHASGVTHLGTAWLVFSQFGGPDLSMILEETAVERSVQLARLVATFGLDVVGDLARPRAANTGLARDLGRSPPEKTGLARELRRPSAAQVGDRLGAESAVCWRGSCRFELVLFSIEEDAADLESAGKHRPFTFRHRERPNAPGTPAG
jgi:hypothetical protein